MSRAAALILDDLVVPDERIAAAFAAEDVPLDPVAHWTGAAVDAGSVAALVTVTTPVGAGLLDQFPNLRAVAVAFTGYDHVDLAACRARGVQVRNVPAYATDSTAELAVAFTLALLRELPAMDARVRGGDTGPPAPGGELAGRTVGIVGTGAIGLRAAELFHAFRCPLLGWSRSERAAFTGLGGRYLDELADLCAQADVVSVHLPSTPQTRGALDAQAIAALRPHALVVNVARADVIDQAALVAARAAGALGGFALDVFDAAGEGVLAQPGTLLAPHVGYRTREALRRRLRTTAANLRAVLAPDAAGATPPAPDLAI